MSVVWALLFAGLYWYFSRYARGAVVVAIGVISHWVLDAISHRPDMPLYPGGTIKVGLGLWNSVPATVAVEGAMFVAGVWLYTAVTRPRDRVGVYTFWAFAAFPALVYAANILSPPPPSPNAVAIVALSAWIVPFWAAWFDRHRARAPASYLPSA